MLKFIPYASGSTGNLYEVTDGKTRILLECGVPVTEIQRLTNYSLDKFDHCFVSHKHKDHNHAASKLIERNGHIWLTYGECLTGGNASWINSMLVEAFAVPHSIPCFGFIIKSVAESMVFMTDLSYCPAPFAFSPTIFALECNYANDLIPADCERPESVFGAHMSINTCIETLQANDLSNTREIWLLHISESHGDRDRFVREVQQATGVPTYARIYG
jgi:ribonuclease BN (tRNA processing enzyme)